MNRRLWGTGRRRRERISRVGTWVVLAAGVWLAGCSGDGAPTRFYSVGTGGTGGIYYPLGGGIASRLSAMDSVGTFTAEVTGGSVENVNRVINGQIDLGFALAITVFQAFHGEGDYQGEPENRLRVVAPLYFNRLHVLVGRNSSAQGISDLRSARVAVGSAGSGTEQSVREILAAHELTYDDIDVRYLSFSESASALRDGAVDAAFLSVGFPAGAVLEATTTGGARLIPVIGLPVERLRDTHPYYQSATIPAGVYPGLDEDLPTVAMMNWVVGLDSLDPAVVQSLLNVLGPGLVSLAQVHEMAGQIDLASLGSAPIPLHDETDRWLAELGSR